MTANRDKERSVVIFRSDKLFEIEAIAQELEAQGINCHIDGKATSSAFAGLTALNGVTTMKLIVLESDEPRAKAIAQGWLDESGADADPADQT